MTQQNLNFSDISLLSPRQAAQLLDISERTLWSMKDRGEIPHIKMGHLVKYPVDDLKRWIDAKKRGGNDDA